MRENADQFSEQRINDNGINKDFEENQSIYNDLKQNDTSARYSYWLVFSWILFTSLIFLTFALIFIIQSKNSIETVVKEYVPSEKDFYATKKEITDNSKYLEIEKG